MSHTENATISENKDEKIEIPSVSQVRKTMRQLSNQLYIAWKKELCTRILDFEFEGYIAQDHIDINPAVWRLPNDEVGYALSKIQDDLDKLGYEYEFKFDDVDDVSWIMFYCIELPDRIEDPDEDVENDAVDSVVV